jgi:hypothetical protein
MNYENKEMEFSFMGLVLRMLSLILFHIIMKEKWSEACEKATKDIEKFRKEYAV